MDEDRLFEIVISLTGGAFSGFMTWLFVCDKGKK